MGILTQPKVTPLPTGINLDGKTIIITGASAGIGLEAARELLILNASTVILAVRNTVKGEQCKSSLLADVAITKNNLNPTVTVMKLDMDDYGSVVSFAAAVKQELPTVDHVLLNAGIGSLKPERSPSGHERTMQANYLFNVLLLLELLPHLEASATRSGHPCRVTWVGSRGHYRSTLSDKAPIKTDETVFGHMDSPKYFSAFSTYNDMKMLCVMFLYELEARLSKNKVVLNMLCPGMIDTAMSDILPIYLRIPVDIVKAIRARSVEHGVWLVLNTILVAGGDSHGQFILDKEPQA